MKFFSILMICVVLCIVEHAKCQLDYRAEMRKFVIGLANYARQTNPNFLVIPQNGLPIMTTNGQATGTIDPVYVNAINGVGQEDFLYGAKEDNIATSTVDINYMSSFLDLAKRYNKKVLITDYCFTPAKMEGSYGINAALGFISFAAHKRALDQIPTYPAKIFNENANNILTLNAAKNFLYLINPQFSSKAAFINAVKNTNYDVVIVDAYYGNSLLTSADVTSLKFKANGARRLVIAYMSIGEAENYRYYWNNWKIGSPFFIVKENPNWAGNFLVQYWQTAWQNFIYGNDASYTKKLIDSSFDGTYLDGIDSFWEFQNLSG